MNRWLLKIMGLWALAMVAGAPAFAADTVYYYHTDALHSAAVITDAYGNVVERTTYYAPFGQVLNRPMRDGPGYTGAEEDPATSLVYMQQRYYDPQSGRFLSTDPVQPTDDGGNFNRYEYAKDNPYRYTDPFGMCADYYKDGTCEVKVDSSLKNNQQALDEQRLVQAMLDSYDKQINALPNDNIYSIGPVNGKDKILGSDQHPAVLTGAEIKKIWNSQHIIIVPNGTYAKINGGEGASIPGQTKLEARAVSDWSAAAGSSATGASSLIFHEFAHVTDFMQYIGNLYPPNVVHPEGTAFERIDQTTGKTMAGSVGAPFSCNTIQGGCW